MIKHFLNRHGKIERGEGLSYELPRDEEFIWLFLAQPTQAETASVTKDFGLNPKHFQTYSRATHSKRYGIKPFEFVFVDYFLEKGKINHTRILFILEKNFLIISVPHEYHYYLDLFERISEQLVLLPNGKKTLVHLLYLWLMEDTEENYDVLAKTEEMIIATEERMMREKKETMVSVEEIVETKRLLFQMTRRFWASAKIIFAIKKGLTPITLDMETMLLLDDVYDTFHHQLDIAAAQKDMLTDALEIYTTLVSNELARINNNMSQVMKTLTALTVIVMVPSFVAGAFGMNFSFIPLSHERYGFMATMTVMFLLSFGIYLIFSKKKWI